MGLPFSTAVVSRLAARDQHHGVARVSEATCWSTSVKTPDPSTQTEESDPRPAPADPSAHGMENRFRDEPLALTPPKPSMSAAPRGAAGLRTISPPPPPSPPARSRPLPAGRA